MGPDAPINPGDSGLIIEWSSTPTAWPSGFVDGVNIERARFKLENLRVIGDAGPGDPRTTVSGLEMGFAWTDAEQRPATMPFDEAPLGLYSQLALVFDGQDSDSYEIRGRVMDDDDQREFRIEDSRPLTFNVAIDEMLSPGEKATIHVRVNFKGALDSIDWDNVEVSDGRYELEDGDSQMTAFRTKLIESFEIVNVAGAR